MRQEQEAKMCNSGMMRVLGVVLGVVVAAAYMLKVIRQVLLGPLHERWSALPDANVREVCSLIPLLALTVAVGVYPLLILHLQDSSIQQLIAHVAGR